MSLLSQNSVLRNRALRQWPFLLLVVMILLGILLFPANIKHLNIAQDWLQLSLVNLTPSADLEDQFPDKWKDISWGGALGSIQLLTEADQSKRLVIRKNNERGAAVLSQSIEWPQNSQLVLKVLYQGDAGAAVQVQAGESSFQDVTFLHLDAAPQFQQQEISFAPPPGTTKGRLLLRGGEGTSFFAHLFLGESGGKNLLKNPDFQADGVHQDAWAWWQQHVLLQPIPEAERGFKNIAYQNAADLSTGKLDAIRERLRQIADGCLDHPEAVGWLLAFEDDFETTGGPAAREKLLQLTLSLAPECSQPYASLAQLYAASDSNKVAADLYHQAAEKAKGHPQSGRYFFEEGFLRLNKTGEFIQAEEAFRKAYATADAWEGGLWYYGASTFYLGLTLEQTGQNQEAQELFQEILNCNQCLYYHDQARKLLQSEKNLPQ